MYRSLQNCRMARNHSVANSIPSFWGQCVHFEGLKSAHLKAQNDKNYSHVDFFVRLEPAVSKISAEHSIVLMNKQDIAPREPIYSPGQDEYQWNMLIYLITHESHERYSTNQFVRAENFISWDARRGHKVKDSPGWGGRWVQTTGGLREEVEKTTLVVLK